ncbi:MAG: hypothetical protein NTX25_03235 [Proteobacteria bacterium]|nr:hypothetical protein [Pseudomonadota bacterium]
MKEKKLRLLKALKSQIPEEKEVSKKNERPVGLEMLDPESKHIEIIQQILKTWGIKD